MRFARARTRSLNRSSRVTARSERKQAMRYMGGVIPAMDPALKQAMMAEAKSLPDNQAADLCDICDATPLGEKQKLTRIAIGAGVGLVAGFVLAKVLKK